MKRVVAIAILLLLAWPALAGAPTGNAIIAGMKVRAREVMPNITVGVLGIFVGIHQLTA